MNNNNKHSFKRKTPRKLTAVPLARAEIVAISEKRGRNKEEKVYSGNKPLCERKCELKSQIIFLLHENYIYFGVFSSVTEEHGREKILGEGKYREKNYCPTFSIFI